MARGIRREKGDSARGRGGPEPILWDALLTAVGRQGFGNTSVQLMLDETGMARATFYNRFQNLGECFLAAYGWKAEELCEKILEASRGGGSWTEGLRRALRALLDFAAEHPHTAMSL
jgi:AcrR family transcriptional regulator